MHFTNLLIIMVVVALLAPLVVNALPALRVPSPVLEIVAGIVLGPSVLGWVHVDAPVEVLALVGLAFLLFLAGLAVVVVLLAVALIRAGRSARTDRVFRVHRGCGADRATTRRAATGIRGGADRRRPGLGPAVPRDRPGDNARRPT